MPNLEQQFCQPCDENDEGQQMMRFHNFLCFQCAQNMVTWTTKPKVVNFVTKKTIPRRKTEIFQKKKIDKFVKAI